MNQLSLAPVAGALADASVVAKRNVVKITRVPEVLVFVLLSPIMFVLLFADDMQKGIITRFRSLPMSRSAVLAGRTASDVIYNVLSILIMVITGLLVGWRIRGSALEALGGFLLILAFAYGFSWVMAYLALLVPSPEVINNASFMVIMPMTFVSNAFVPLESLPGPLQAFSEWNPVSAVTQAARELFGNIPAGTPEPSAWSMQNPAIYTLLWVGIMVAVFAPLAVRRYGRSSHG